MRSAVEQVLANFTPVQPGVNDNLWVNVMHSIELYIGQRIFSEVLSYSAHIQMLTFPREMQIC